MTSSAMEPLQKEHEKVWSTTRVSKTLDQTQDIITALQTARNAIVSDPATAQITLAKLQNPIKTSFDNLNTSTKETYQVHRKYEKSLEKFFKDKPLPNDEIDTLSSNSALVNRAIYMHLLREGLFEVAATFYREATSKVKSNGADDMSNGVETEAGNPRSADPNLSDNMEQQFAEMYKILRELKDNRNLNPAIVWAREHAQELEIRGSNLEFELCRLQYVSLFLGGNSDNTDDISITTQMHALEYAQREFQSFRGRYMHQIQQLMGAMAFSSNLEDSPYRHIFNNSTAWSEVATSFTREFCSLLKLSADSPLYIATTAGAIAMPTLQKMQGIMQIKRTEWTSANELSVEIPLPPAYYFHSIFVCPVSKEQTTDQNPPMMMPCGHVVAQESLQKLSKGSKFKCPYCPMESRPQDATKVYL